jgi:hypothetical protein
MPCEGVQEPELEGCEADRQATGHDEAPGVVDGDRTVVVVLQVRGFGGATEERLDPGQQLLAAEGLHNVVVGARTEASNLVDLAAPRGEQDYRHVAQVAQALQRLESIEVRHREIEDDDVSGVLVEDAERCAPVLSRLHEVTGSRQELVKEQADIVVVVDDKNPPRGRRRRHSGSVWGTPQPMERP